mmetsp:Transcript_17025/g.53124  ORF Transcript_17025/g.53124 Transcript_17025/m.53124 type:complete len:222 (-) Transcript_17025:1946-2611(-)
MRPRIKRRAGLGPPDVARRDARLELVRERPEVFSREDGPPPPPILLDLAADRGVHALQRPSRRRARPGAHERVGRARARRRGVRRRRGARERELVQTRRRRLVFAQPVERRRRQRRRARVAADAARVQPQDDVHQPRLVGFHRKLAFEDAHRLLVPAPPRGDRSQPVSLVDEHAAQALRLAEHGPHFQPAPAAFGVRGRVHDGAEVFVPRRRADAHHEATR